MRTNKFIPFYLALLLHLIPLIFYLFKRPVIQASVLPPQGIGLSAFSISERSIQLKTQTKQNYTETVGLSSQNGAESMPSRPGDKNGIEGTGGIGNNTGPVFINFNEPTYPPVARQKGWEGKVKIKAYYDQGGSITKIDIVQSSGIKMLDESVKKTALSWKLSSSTGGSFEKVFEFKLNN